MSTTFLAVLFLTVTNHVGTAIHGEYVRTTSSHLFLRNSRQETFSVPYAALPKAERDRVRLSIGVWQPPQEYRDLEAFYRNELKRINLLEKEGVLTAEEAARRRAGEKKSFDGVCQRMIREGRLPDMADVPHED